MAKEPVIKIGDIKDIAEIMTKTEIGEVEKSFVKEALKAKEAQAIKAEEPKPTILVVEEIEVDDGNRDIESDRDEER